MKKIVWFMWNFVWMIFRAICYRKVRFFENFFRNTFTKPIKSLCAIKRFQNRNFVDFIKLFVKKIVWFMWNFVWMSFREICDRKVRFFANFFHKYLYKTYEFMCNKAISKSEFCRFYKAICEINCMIFVKFCMNEFWRNLR